MADKKFLSRFTEHPLPVLFAVFYMIIVWDAYQWMKGLEHPEDAQWIMNGLVLGAVGYFKFYTDLIMGSHNE